ncbi:MAG TPA: 23S rRNA (adenine(2503)-C(2))-methyltransferase RlmN [Candidatus Bathyarchaeia archaeon]|nr:23S rRNA (adenine(2503)-C(2))-methyltransferase RlmN [Candidatus Bathyarchaeia archaeon]
MNIDLNLVCKNEPQYRISQIKTAVFKNLISDWSEAKNLPLSLRQKLEKQFPLTIKAKTFVSRNKKTIKILITLKDGLRVESVLMRHKDGRNTVCVSSQVGCSLACKFCATGKMGFKRNLEPKEIINQVLFFSRLLKKESVKVTNLVFMGMGEPFLNYKNVIAAIRILNDKDGFNLGQRKFSISTSGIIEGIKKLSREKLEVNLAISLHAPNDQLRSKLMPINRKYPLNQVFKAVDDYIQKTHRKVMFEYLMIKGVNDSKACAQELVSLMKKKLFLVNLISYNPTGIFTPSPPKQIEKFKAILEKGGINVTRRYRFGQGIKAGCGQLVY